VLWSDIPKAAAIVEFQYVTPSQPQTGFSVGSCGGFGAQVPVVVPQATLQ
jgi:hypothetical protein